MYERRYSSSGKANVAFPKPSIMPNVNIPSQLKVMTTESTSSNSKPRRKVYTTEDTTVSRSSYPKAPTEIHLPVVSTVNVNHSKGITISVSHHINKTRKSSLSGPAGEDAQKCSSKGNSAPEDLAGPSNTPRGPFKAGKPRDSSFNSRKLDSTINTTGSTVQNSYSPMTTAKSRLPREKIVTYNNKSSATQHGNPRASPGCGSSGPRGMYHRQESPLGRAPWELAPPPTWSRLGPPRASPPKASPPKAGPPKANPPKAGILNPSPPSKPSKMVFHSQQPSHLDSTVAIQKTVKSTQSPRTDAHEKFDEVTKQRYLESHNCFLASIDEETGEVIYRNPAVSKHDDIQDNLEVVLFSISIAAEIFSLVLLSIIRVKKSLRLFVHKNLLLSLAIGHLVFILDVKVFDSKNEHSVICSTVTAIQHYIHTTLYMWMLVEGINLYLKMVRVFTAERSIHYLSYSLLGWGIPAVIVGLVAAIKPSTYDMSIPLQEYVTCGSLQFTVTYHRKSCWINGSLWTFKGPVLAILLANLVVFLIVLRVSYGKISAKYGKTSINATKRGLKSIVTLLPLLGVTFLLGFFLEFHIAVSYAFIVLNSTQGVLFFICHCVFDDQVRDAVRKLIQEKKGIQNPEQCRKYNKANKKTCGNTKQTGEHKATEVMLKKTTMRHLETAI